MIKIKQLFDEITKQKVYPLTTIKAVRDPSTKKSLAELLLVGEDVGETQDTPTKDADILGGKYRASDIDKSMTYDEDESTEVVENVEIVDADRLGGKYTAYDIDVIKQDITDINSSLSNIGKATKLFEDSGAFSQKTVKLLDSIANYKELLFYMTDGPYIIQTIILPVDLYRIQGNVGLCFTVKGGNFSVQTYYIKYIDDNTIQATGNYTDGRAVVIYGIK